MDSVSVLIAAQTKAIEHRVKDNLITVLQRAVSDFPGSARLVPREETKDGLHQPPPDTTLEQPLTVIDAGGRWLSLRLADSIADTSTILAKPASKWNKKQLEFLGMEVKQTSSLEELFRGG